MSPTMGDQNETSRQMFISCLKKPPTQEGGEDSFLPTPTPSPSLKAPEFLFQFYSVPSPSPKRGDLILLSAEGKAWAAGSTVAQPPAMASLQT